MSDRTGQRLDNYHLIRLLGAGSFGEVYLAEYVYRKTQVAVKVLPQLADDDLPGFLNEARTIRLRHPRIVQVLDFGVDNRIPFIVMEYIPNGTLRQRYPKGTRLPLDKLVPYVKQVADALQYAHDEKLIHRDVKPENILLRSNDEVLLSDFGIATMARSSHSQSVLEMAGTLAYMAPEQIQGKPVLASDQYALGVIVYEWLCGERPFNGGPIEIATQHLLARPPSLRVKVPMFSSDIEQVVMTALEKEPSKRFASVQAFAHALEQASKPKGSVHFPVSNSVPSMPVVPPISSSPKEQPINIAPSSSQQVNSPIPNTTLPASEKPLLPPSLPPVVSDTLPTSKPIISPKLRSESETGSGRFVAPTSMGNQIRHSRLFYPSLILLVLLLVGMVGGGGYFYLKATTNINVPQKLHDAQRAITKARGEVAVNPVASLRDLATAQSTLRTLLTSSLTDDQHSTVLHLLQGDLTRAVQAAISSYNTKDAITSLPCGGMSAPTPLNVGTTSTQVKTITLVPGKSGHALLYAIGLDSKLYQVVNSSLIPVALPALLNTRVLDIATYGQQLLLLTAQPASGTPTSYSLALLAPDQSKVEATAIGPFLGKDGQVPKLIAASPPDIYVVIAADSTQTMTTILDYAPTNKVHQLLGTPPVSSTITVSNPIMSMAAFPMHQLFLLQADGMVQSLQFASGDHATTSVLLQQAIAQPLPVSAKDFTWTMTVPTVTPGGMTSLSVPGATLPHTLAVGLVNTVPHLYILDATLHRILDLKVADASAGAVGSSTTTTSSVTPTATNTGGGAVTTATPVTLHLERQYASPTLFAQAKSMAVDPQGTQVNVVAQTPSNASSMLSLVSFNASSQIGCA